MPKWCLGLALLAGSFAVPASSWGQIPPPLGGPANGPAPPWACPPAPVVSVPDGENSFNDGNACCPDERCCGGKGFQFSAELLLWWLKDSKPPPLITTGALIDPVPGALGQRGTTVFAGSDIEAGNHIGARFGGLYRLDEREVLSAESNFFILEQLSAVRTASSGGTRSQAVIARPFFNPNTNREDADPVAVTSVQAGNVTASVTDRFMGAEANIRVSEPCCSDWTHRFSLLAGVRYLYLDEKLFVSQFSQDLPVGAPNTTRVILSDDFTAFNRYYGGQVGAEAKFRWEIFDLSLLGKIGAGETFQVVRIRGATQLTQANGRTFTASDRGLLAQPTNVGRSSRHEFSIVPEGVATVGCQLHDHIRVFFGYTLLYWTDVARPADHIDRVVNVQPLNAPGRLGTAARPAFAFTDSDFWVQGFNFGVEFSY